MSNYTKTTDFAAKDSLPSGHVGKVVKGTEIDTEFNNIAIASATKANANNAALTGTSVFETLSDGTLSVTGWVDEDNMASDSNSLIPTQQSVKAYVDSNVTAQDLDVTDGSSSIDIDLDSESLGILGGTGVTSTASGTGVTLAIDSTVATLTGTQTLTNKTLTTPTILTSFTIGSATITEAELEILDGATVTTAELNHVDGVTSNIQTQLNTKAPVAGATFTGTTTIPTADINGGAIDGTVIGGSTAAAGSFTTVAASSSLTIGGVTSVPFEAADHSKLDGIEASADVTDATNVTAAGALMDSEVTNLAQVKAFASSDYATSAQGTTADAALPKTGGAMTGAITTNSTFDGRDVATDGTKLDGIEASADVTDAANVTSAGALMDSELTSIASVKAMNQGVATSDSPTFAGITTSGITNTANLKISGAQGTDGQVLTSTGSGVQWENAGGGGVTGISSGTSTTILTLSSANKVGIGQGVGNALALLHLYQSSGSGDLFKIQTGAGGKLLMNSSGNLGIGTDSPSQLLDVNGTVELNNLTVGGSQGSDGQVLTSTGSGIAWEAVGAPSTPGINNVRLGTNAGANFNNYAERNVAIGVEAAQDFITDGQTQADENVALGYRAMGDGRSPNGNAAVGAYALETVRYDGSSVSFGSVSSTGAFNIGIGYKVAQSAIKLNSCILMGYETAKVLGTTSNYAAVGVLAIGNRALYSNTGQPSELCVIGNDAMYNYTYSNPAYTCVVGYRAGYDLTTGYANTFFGNGSGDNITTGYYNTIIGFRSKGTANVQKATVLGAEVTASGSETFTFGYSSNDSAIANGATTITAPSDERYKEEITDATAGLSFIKDLRPVTFKWKKEKDVPNTHNAYVEDSEVRVMNDKTNHGFIAQEVKAVIDSHSEIKDGFDMWKEDASDGRQRLGPSALIPILVKAIQELEARVNELESS